MSVAVASRRLMDIGPSPTASALPAAFHDSDDALFSTSSYPSHSDDSLLLSPSPLHLTPLPDYLSEYLSDPLLLFDTRPDSRASLDSPLPIEHGVDIVGSERQSSATSSSIPSNRESSISSATSIATSLTSTAAAIVESALSSAAPAGRRKRTAGADRDRLMRKRRKQRECDIDRRERESTALVQLQQLIRDEHKDDELTPHDQLDTTAKQHKADILQQSVQLIHLLKRRLAATGQPTNQPQPPADSPLSHFASATVASHLRHSSLQSPLRGDHSTVCLILIHCPTNRIIDVTTRFLTTTGWQRPNLVGRIWPALQTKANTTTKHRSQQPALLRDNPVLVQGRGGVGVLVASRQEAQYERSVRLRRQLYGGEIDTIDAVWRSQLADGRLYEFEATSWVSQWEDVEFGGGGSDRFIGGERTRQKRPCYAMSVVSGTRIVCVE